jgi:hypothetical protein
MDHATIRREAKQACERSAKARELSNKTIKQSRELSLRMQSSLRTAKAALGPTSRASSPPSS